MVCKLKLQRIISIFILFRYHYFTSSGFGKFFLYDYICWSRIYNYFSCLQSFQLEQVKKKKKVILLDKNIFSMQQGKMFFIMGLCMALVQGGYVRRIPHGKEITAAMTVSHL